MKHTISLIALLAAAPSFAESVRELDAHEHGVGELNIAVDGTTVLMELHAPGADIVGFEYEAENDEDLAAIENAITTLSDPFSLFTFTSAAGCSVISAHAELESEAGDHDDHDDHDNHDDHDDHDDHEEGASHTEFHAEYAFECANPSELTSITFGYFTKFENALELEIQIVSEIGAQAFEVERTAPELMLEGF